MPEGPFDLVVSALAVHHIDGTGKAGLFQRISSTLDMAGRFVLADVVEPVDPSCVVTEIDPGVDHPSKLDEQLAWLEAARLFPEVTWTHRDLVVIVASSRLGLRRNDGRLPQHAGMSLDEVYAYTFSSRC